jgi:hypothetical protein
MIALALAGCSSPCDEFYDAYKECGFVDEGEDVNTLTNECKEAVDRTDACSAGYDALVECIDGLEDPCTYPEACSDDLFYAYAACD